MSERSSLHMKAPTGLFNTGASVCLIPSDSSFHITNTTAFVSAHPPTTTDYIRAPRGISAFLRHLSLLRHVIHELMQAGG